MSSSYKVLAQGINRAEYTSPNNTNTIVSKLKVKNISNENCTVDISLTQNSASNFKFENLKNVSANNSINYYLGGVYNYDGRFKVLKDRTMYLENFHSVEVSSGVTPLILKILPDGTVDTGFVMSEGPYNGANLNSITRRGFDVFENKKLIHYGVNISNNYGPMIKFNENGTVDTTFHLDINGLPVDPSGYVQIRKARILENNKILVLLVSQRYQTCLVRFNEDGTRDNTFPLVSTDATHNGNNSGYQYIDFDVAPDNKIVLSGPFTIVQLNTGPISGCSGILRLNENGTIDYGFTTVISTFANTVFSNNVIQSYVKVLSNNKIIVVTPNYQMSVNGVSNKLIYRLNSDGTTDNTYNNDHEIDLSSGLRSGQISPIISKDGIVIIIPGPSSSNVRTIDGVFRLRSVAFDPDGNVIEDFFNSSNAYTNVNTDKGIYLISRETNVGLGTASGYYQLLYYNSNNNKTFLVKNKSLTPLEEINIDGGIVVEENYKLDVMTKDSVESLVQIYGTEEV